MSIQREIAESSETAELDAMGAMEAAASAEQPATEEPSEAYAPETTEQSVDIYTLLGVRRDASPLLAREMYWSRVEPLMSPERRDDRDARRTIEDLNRALAIIADAELRAAYDRRFADVPLAEVERRRGSAAIRWIWRAFLLLGLTAAALGLGFASNWVVGAAAAGGILVFAIAVGLLTRPKHARLSALAQLGLSEGATKHDLDVAYQSRAQELLLRLGSDARAVEALNALDEHYLVALRRLITPEAAPQPARSRAWVGAGARGARGARQLVLRMALLGIRGVAASTAFINRQATELASRAAGASARAGASTARTVQQRMAETRTRPTASRARADILAPRDPVAPTVEDELDVDADDEVDLGLDVQAAVRTSPAPQLPAASDSGMSRRLPLVGRAPAQPPLIDLEQRLAASLKANALEIASRAEPSPAEQPEAPPRTPPIPAFLLLYASAGVRRVPIADRPLRLGTAAECDLVLPKQEGVAAEHALVWRRGDAVVLHVTDPAGECLVNGAPSSWATLEHGDELRVGPIKLGIEIGAPAP